MLLCFCVCFRLYILVNTTVAGASELLHGHVTRIWKWYARMEWNGLDWRNFHVVDSYYLDTIIAGSGVFEIGLNFSLYDMYVTTR